MLPSPSASPRKRSLAAAGALGIILALLAACGEVGVCDIREAACQIDTYTAVLTVRDEPWDLWSEPPDIRVISADQYRSELVAENTDSYTAPTAWDSGLRLLGMLAYGDTLDDSAIDTQVDSVAAYYSAATKQVTIIDHGKVEKPEQSTFVLAHEFVHAVQDRYGELGEGGPGMTDDESFARRCAIEGAAVLYANLVLLRARDLGFDEVDWEGYYASMLTDHLTRTKASATPLYEALFGLPYPVGGRLATQAYAQGGNPAVTALFASPPTTSVEAMKGYDQEIAQSRVACEPAVATGYRGVSWDRFGAVGVYAFLARSEDKSDAAWQTAQEWRDDFLALMQSATTSDVALVWRIRFSSRAAALAFRNAAPPSDNYRILVLDTEAVVAASDEEGLFTSYNGSCSGSY